MRIKEVNGVKLSVGLDYIIDLTKSISDKYGNPDLSIDEALEKCFNSGSGSMSGEQMDNIVTAVLISINGARAVANEPALTRADIIALFEEKGFAFISSIVEVLINSMASIITNTGDEVEGSKKKG